MLVVSLFLRFGLPVLFGGHVQNESYGEILFAVGCRHDLPLGRGFDSEEASPRLAFLIYTSKGWIFFQDRSFDRSQARNRELRAAPIKCVHDALWRFLQEQQQRGRMCVLRRYFAEGGRIPVAQPPEQLLAREDPQMQRALEVATEK